MLTPQQLAQLEEKYDATRNWFGFSDWDALSFGIQGALMAAAKWQKFAIDAGVLAVARDTRFTYVEVDTEAQLNSDDLESIATEGFSDGDLIHLRQLNVGRLINIVHGTGNLKTGSRSNFTLDSTNQDGATFFEASVFMLNKGAWLEVSRSPLPSVGGQVVRMLQLSPADRSVNGGTLPVDYSMIHARYVDFSSLVAASGTIDVTVAGGDEGDIAVVVQMPAGLGDFLLGTYRQLVTDAEADIEMGVAAAINANTAATGWSAIYNPISFLTEVYAPTDLGATPNAWTLDVGNGTSSTIVVAGMAGGVDGTETSTTIDTISGMAGNAIAVVVNANAVGTMRFVLGGNLIPMGGSILHPGQMAVLLENGGPVIAMVLDRIPDLVSIASVDLLQLGTVPYQLIAAPGLDEVWEYELFIKLLPGGTPYTMTAPILQIKGTSGTVYSNVTTTMLTGATVRALKVLVGSLSPVVGGEGIFITTSDGSDPTSGDGTWSVSVKKTLHKFA